MNVKIKTMYRISFYGDCIQQTPTLTRYFPTEEKALAEYEKLCQTPDGFLLCSELVETKKVFNLDNVRDRQLYKMWFGDPGAEGGLPANVPDPRSSGPKTLSGAPCRWGCERRPEYLHKPCPAAQDRGSKGGSTTRGRSRHRYADHFPHGTVMVCRMTQDEKRAYWRRMYRRRVDRVLRAQGVIV